jgi:hypothetical protein
MPGAGFQVDSKDSSRATAQMIPVRRNLKPPLRLAAAQRPRVLMDAECEANCRGRLPFHTRFCWALDDSVEG